MRERHHIHRHPALPWAELRVSRESPLCYRLHTHEEYSLGIVDEGQALFTHPGGTQGVQPGTVVLIEPGVWHACNPDQVTHWSYRMLYVQADWLHALLGVPAHTRLRFATRAVAQADFSAAAHLLCQALLGQDTPAAKDWAADLRALLLRAGLAAAAPPQAGDAALEPIAAAVMQLHANMHTAPGQLPAVQTLADDCGMSSSRFIRQFKAATGVTPGAYRMNLRLNGARRLLAQGTALAEAAQAMGFADQAHLQRAFKSHHALTPGRYAQRVDCAPVSG